MNTMTMNRTTFWTAPLALLALAGAALACDPSAPSAQGTEGASARLIRAASTTHSEHTWSDDANKVRVERNEGVTKVYLNGKEIMAIPDAQLLGADVGDIAEFARRRGDMAREIRRSFQNRGIAPPTPPMPGFPADMPRPRVMIGITMESASEANITVPGGVDPDDATVVTRVVEGLPAEKAGLTEGDIVVKVNGSDDASPDQIREAIRSKNPGDELTLRIVRDGTEQDVRIALDAYDSDRLGAPSAWAGRWWGGDEEEAEAPTPEDLARIDELRAKIEETTRKMGEVGAKMSATTEEEQLRLLGRQLGELSESLAEQSAEIGELSGQQNMMFRFLAPGQQGFNLRDLPRMRIERHGGSPRAWVFAEPDEQAQEDSEDKPGKEDSINERLERLEKLIKRLAEEQKEQH